MTAFYKIAQYFLTIVLTMTVKYKQLLLLILFFAQSSYSSNLPSPSSDTRFFTATAAAYQDLLRNPKIGPSITDLDEIIKISEAAIKSKDSITAIATILSNMPAIARQIHLPQIQKISALALSLHNIAIAETLLKTAKNQGDTFSEARITFELAKYYADQGQWSNVIIILKDSRVIENLTKDDAAEANLLIGSALQQQKKHREAMVYYDKIKPESIHYRLAQLNLATANIRQDWWTDAHLAIQRALKASGSERDELYYRLYTVLGFSQLQFGFYRDARESFRNISLNSDYINRALLGLGMAALHQEDFIGALNAFNLLREKNENDISVAESHLLVAFTLRQLGQSEAALKAYQEAIDYYSTLLSKQKEAISSITPNPTEDLLMSKIFLRPETRNNKQLNEIAEKITIISNLQKYSLSSNRINELAAAKQFLEKEYIGIAQELLDTEQESIASYLSQSKFGLATIYDGK